MTVMRKLCELVLDFDLYPRAQVDSHHVREMRDARAAGATFPPFVIDKKSKRVTDGFHRHTMYRLDEDDPNFKVECIEKAYRNEKEMLLDAIRFNVTHGRRLTPFDKARAAILAQKLGIADGAIAKALSLTPDSMGQLLATKVALGGNGKKAPVAIKRTIGHMAGKKLTKPQVEANRKLGGMNQTFYVNQLITLIEANLIDKENEELIGKLRTLHSLLDGVLAAG